MSHEFTQIFPLTEMQKGMLFHSVMEPSSGIYCEQFMFEITGALDLAQLRAAWQSVVNENDILRIATRYSAIREPVQVVYPSVESTVEFIDLSRFPSGEQASQLETWLAEDRAKGFVLQTPRPIRAALFRRAPESHLLLLTYHHLILDAWSLFLLMKELIEQYDTGSSINKVRPFYSEYVRSLRANQNDDSRDFWRHYLSGYNRVTQVSDVVLGGVPSRNSIDTHHEIVRDLPRLLSDQLMALSRQSGLTTNTLIQGAWGLVIAEASKDDDVVFGITITHRPHQIANIDRMVGIFINSLPKRVRLPHDKTLREYLLSIQQDQTQIKEHEHVALPDIQNLSEIDGGKPIFETLLIFENFLKNPSWQQARDFTVKYFRYIGWTNYPLAIEAMPAEGARAMFFQVKFDSNYFSRQRIDHLLDRLAFFLQTIVTDLELPIREVVQLRPRVAGNDAAREPAARVPLTVDADVCRALVKIWSTVLEVAEFDDTRSFFEVGGHSLLLFRLQAEMQVHFGIEIDIVELFDHPTVDQQASLVEARRAAQQPAPITSETD